MKTANFDMALDPESFKMIADLAYRESGLQLVTEKTSMIQSRLRHRLTDLELTDFKSYSHFVCSSDGIAERRQMISALTTNVSHFFREKHHFDCLAGQIFPGLLDELKSGGKLRIWSAGCSNGQEAVSTAISLAEICPKISDYDVKILATDIDPKVVSFATEGRYSEKMVGGLASVQLEKYFAKVMEKSEVIFEVKRNISDLIRFKELNLLSEWPMRGAFDVIFCRNVVIYFDVQTQNNLWPRFHRFLKPEGHLFLGHSERISDPETFGFYSDGPTCYRTIKRATPIDYQRKGIQ